MVNMDVKTPNTIEDTDRLLGTRTKMKKKSWRNHITKLGYTAYITAKLNTVQLNKEKTASIKSNQTQAVEKIPRVSIRREVKIPVKKKRR